MKKLLMIAGAIFLVLIVVIGIAIGIMAIKGSKLDAESKAYAESILPQLLSDFTTDNFLKYVAPDNKDKVDRASLDKFTSLVKSNLGSYKSCGDLKGDSNINMNVSSGKKEISAKYVTTVNFDKASVLAQIILIKSGDAWSLARINMDLTESVLPNDKKENGAQ